MLTLIILSRSVFPHHSDSKAVFLQKSMLLGLGEVVNDHLFDYFVKRDLRCIHPRSSFAFDGSPWNVSSSEGQKYLLSIRTRIDPVLISESRMTSIIPTSLFSSWDKLFFIHFFYIQVLRLFTTTSLTIVIDIYSLRYQA
jgi:hypothetical protein